MGTIRRGQSHSRIFQGPEEAHRTPQSRDALREQHPYLRAEAIHEFVPNKEEISQGLLPASPGSFALPHWVQSYRYHVEFGILPDSFRWGEGATFAYNASLQDGIPLSLRIDWPMFSCCSHGTLLHFGLQSSHLNVCYYHQDLRQQLSRTRFKAFGRYRRGALYSSETWHPRC